MRAEVARRYPWNPAFGPTPQRNRVGGESRLQRAMQEDGLAGQWIPNAVVEHFVPASSMTLDYIRYRYRLHGRTLMVERRSLLSGARSLLAACEAYPRYLIARGLGRAPARWLKPYRRAQTHLGRLSGLFEPVVSSGAPPA